MSRAAIAIVAATALAAAGPAFAGTAAPQAPTPADARPVSGTAAVIGGGDTAAVAWLQDEAGDPRVLGSSTAGSESVRLGPAGAGVDGAPVAAVTADGSFWVMASRAADGAQRLWLQRHAAGAWNEAVPGPTARRYDHHPALAAIAGTNELWAAWIGEDGAGNAALWASRWTGSRWTGAEALPSPVGEPMAPAIAIDAAGAPVVVWAASDGNDAEIWVSTRRAASWSAPRALTRNQVPDVTPSIAATGTGLMAAWITYTDAGYLPAAATATRAGAWEDAEIIDTTPGGRPRALAIDGSPAVLWRRLEDAPAGATIVARRRAAGTWQEVVPLAAVSASPFSIATAADGRLLLAFSRPGGALGIIEGERGAADRLQSLARAAAARYGDVSGRWAPLDAPPAPVPTATPTVPDIYTAFGDSITNGVVYDPDRRTSAGYRDPLQQMLRGLFRLGTVFNAGVDGETTSDGVGRIDNAISEQNPQAILIMEGTNDILAAVDVDTIAFNLRRMVQRSYDEKPDIKPFLAQLPPRLDPGPEGFDGPGNGRIDELNALLPEIGQEEGAVIVDMNTPIDGHYELMSNHVHPSVAGYGVMADQWFEAIKPVVFADTNRGDLDASGRTDGIDLVQLALAFGSIEGEDRYDPAADINGDGLVDGFDLDMLIEFFGRDVSGAGGGGS